MDVKFRDDAGRSAYQAPTLDSDGDEIMRDSGVRPKGRVTFAMDNKGHVGAIPDGDTVMDDVFPLQGKDPVAAPTAAPIMAAFPATSAGSTRSIVGDRISSFQDRRRCASPTFLDKEEIMCDLILLKAAVELREAEEANKDEVLRPLCEDIRHIRFIASSDPEAARLSINTRSGKDHTTTIDVAATNGCPDIIDDAVRLGGDVNATPPNGRTALHCAAYWNRPTCVTRLVDHGANVEAQDKEGWTPLHAASVTGSSRSVTALLRCGADKDGVGGRGRPPLHVAAETCRLNATTVLLVAGADTNLRHGEHNYSALDSAAVGGCPEVLQLILRHGADVNAIDSAGVTALYLAARHDRDRAVDLLVNAGANVEAQDHRGWTPLHVASAVGASRAIESLLRHGVDRSKPDRRDRAPLHLAAERGHTSAVAHLLESGADPELRVQSPYYHYSAVDAAAANGHLDVLKMFTRHGVDVNASDSDNITALHLAARYDKHAVITFLVEAGADIEAENFMGWTPLRTAVENESWAAMGALLRLGADRNTVDGKGRTVLHFAAERGLFPAIASLITSGANTDLRCQVGDNQFAALDLAASQGQLRSLRTLLKYGADVNAVDALESTALHAAARNDQKEAIHVLADGGGDTEAADSLGCTPLHIAALRNATSAVVALLEHNADTSKANNDERTPLHLSAEFGHVSASAALMAAGADITLRCEDNEPSALDIAAAAGKVDVLKEMMDYGADVNSVDSDGRTPLVIAVASNEAGAVDVLAEAGARVDALVENNSWTSLHVAAEYLYPDVVRTLLKHGARVNARDVDHHNDTPLHIAARQVGMEGAAEVVEALLERGADERSVNALNLTPADVAHGQVGSGAGVSAEDIAPVVKLLVRAAGNRKWRRRRMLILCYARGRKNLSLHGNIHPASAGASFTSLGVSAGVGGKMRRRGQRKGCKLSFRGVATWLLEVEEEGLLRSVVSFL